MSYRKPKPVKLNKWGTFSNDIDGELWNEELEYMEREVRLRKSHRRHAAIGCLTTETFYHQCGHAVSKTLHSLSCDQRPPAPWERHPPVPRSRFRETEEEPLTKLQKQLQIHMQTPRAPSPKRLDPCVKTQKFVVYEEWKGKMCSRCKPHGNPVCHQLPITG